jgi:F-type H+-transporting ATPase subunit b
MEVDKDCTSRKLSLLLKFFVSCVVFTAVTPLLSVAVSGNGHEAASHSLLVPWVNFTVYVVLLVYFLKKPLAEIFLKRADSVRSNVQKAKEEFNLAKERFDRARYNFENKEALAEEVVIHCNHIAEQEAVRINSDAERRAQHIIARARQQVESEERALLKSIKADAIKGMVSQLEDMIRQKHTYDVDVSRILENISKNSAVLANAVTVSSSQD